MRKLFIFLFFVTNMYAIDSREGDSLGLVALMDANPNSNLTWDTAASLDTWEGLAFRNDRVCSLGLESMNISNLPNTLSYITRLEFLILSDNKISDIQMGISHLKYLRYFDLSKNPGITFTNISNGFYGLNFIILDSCELDAIPAEILKLTHLPGLYMNGNNLSAIPAEIAQMTELGHLQFRNNNITEIPTEIENLQKLRYLELDSNGISELPTQLFKCLKLRELSLSNNKFSYIANNFTNLDSLYALDFSSNKISKIPDSLFYCKSLLDLNLSNNQISEIPASIENFTTLRYLYLSNNQIDSIPLGISNCTKLTEIEMSNNNLTFLPPIFDSMTNISLIDFSHNFITNFPTGLGDKIRFHKVLMEDNYISSIPEEMANCSAWKVEFYKNCLSRETLSPAVAEWLDKKNYFWDKQQKSVGTVQKEQTISNAYKRYHISDDRLIFYEMPSPGTVVEIYSVTGRRLFKEVVSGLVVRLPKLSKGQFVVRVF